jgi:hypothetical protein
VAQIVECLPSKRKSEFKSHYHNNNKKEKHIIIVLKTNYVKTAYCDRIRFMVLSTEVRITWKWSQEQFWDDGYVLSPYVFVKTGETERLRSQHSTSI